MPEYVRVVGARQAQGFLEALAKNAESAQGFTVRVGSPLAYAYGIETGRHRNGSLARAAGGLFYLSRALQAEQPSIAKVVAKHLEDGQPARNALIVKGFDVERRAKQLLTPFPYSPRTKYRTGTLRRSIQTTYPGKPVMPVIEAQGRRGVTRTRTG